MVMIPLPWVLSIFAVMTASIIGSQGRLPVGCRVFFVLGLFALACVAGIVGLRLMVGQTAWFVLQPYLALVVSAGFFLGFQSLTQQEGWPSRRTLLLHGFCFTCALAAIAVPVFWSADLVVTLWNLSYLLLLFGFLRRPTDAFLHVPNQSAGSLRVSLVAVIAFLSFVLLADLLIIYATLSAGHAQGMRLLSGASGVIVLIVVLGVAIGVPIMLSRNTESSSAALAPNEASSEDELMFERVSELMQTTQLYKDPSLTLARLGKRLGCPARAVSNAVNRKTGENVSRFINRYRVEYAADLLRVSELPVTEVMLDAGFLSKSSFNTEFRRITGKTPSEFRRST